jgi:ribonuclease J
VPVHGEMRHMQEQARLGRANGIRHAVVQQNGDIIRLAPGEPAKLAQVPAGRLVLDGDIIVPADGEAIVTRRRIARDGMLIVALDAARRPHIHGFGLPLDEDYAEFVEEAERDVSEALKRLKGPKARDRDAIVEAARIAARRAAQRWSGKKPQTKVLLLDDRG